MTHYIWSFAKRAGLKLMIILWPVTYCIEDCQLRRQAETVAWAGQSLQPCCLDTTVVKKWLDHFMGRVCWSLQMFDSSSIEKNRIWKTFVADILYLLRERSKWRREVDEFEKGRVWRNFSYKDKTWAEFSTLVVAVCMVCRYISLKQNCLT